MVATSGMLDKNGVIAYLGQVAPQYGVDPAAMLAIANSEGLNTTPGSTWTVPGESGPSFGPPSWFSGGAGGTLMQKFGFTSASQASQFAWSPAGLDYWIQQVAGVAKGLTGSAAISAIVSGFERPSTNYHGVNLAQKEINTANGLYSQFQQAIGGSAGTPIPSDTGTQDTTGTQGTTGAQDQSQQGASGPNTSASLSFSDTLGHTATQFLIVLVAIALLLGGIYLLGSRK